MIVTEESYIPFASQNSMIVLVDRSSRNSPLIPAVDHFYHLDSPTVTKKCPGSLVSFVSGVALYLNNLESFHP